MADGPEPPEQPQPSPPADTADEQPRANGGKRVLCPYCGHTQTDPVRCEQCKGLFEPLSRKATQIAMGPWYIRDPANPFRPGCSYETLQRQIEAGRVTARSIIRGPTTRQFWAVAHNVPGVAHLVGHCHRCNARVRPTDTRCPACGETFSAVTSVRNELGLLYPTRNAAETAQHELEQQRRALVQDPSATTSTAPATTSPASSATAPPTPAGGDLLDQVLQQGGPAATPPPTAGPTSPAPSEAQALDFAPSEATDQASHDEARTPAPQRPSLLIWLLVVLNAIAAAGVVLLALFVFGQ
ncbi:MAG: hypothetical protein ACODAQ_09865 [Phycisphaeraceae bacterium]